MKPRRALRGAGDEPDTIVRLQGERPCTECGRPVGIIRDHRGDYYTAHAEPSCQTFEALTRHHMEQSADSAPAAQVAEAFEAAAELAMSYPHRCDCGRWHQRGVACVCSGALPIERGPKRLTPLPQLELAPPSWGFMGIRLTQ